MEISEENKQLFAEQVGNHIERLNTLMNLAAGEPFDKREVQKACLATRLLQGSTGMLGLGDWSGTLGLLKELLEKSLDSGSCWDENFSQIVSEIVEVEDQVLSDLLSGDALSHESFGGLQHEIECLLAEMLKSPASGKPPVESEPVKIARKCRRRDDDFATLSKLMESLEAVNDRFFEYMESPEKCKGGICELERALGNSEYLMSMVMDIVSRLGSTGRPFVSEVSSATVLDGLQDFLNLHGRLKHWNAELNCRVDNFYMPSDTARTLAVILENCLYDACRIHESKGDDSELNFDLDISEKGSYLQVNISDNGTSFLCDSEIDRDDAVAFYQGLRAIRNHLGNRGGLLWVEPDREIGCRFRFTLPRTGERTDFQIFRASGKALAVPCHCIDSIVDKDKLDIQLDNAGRSVVLSGMRIPICSMDELVSEETDPRANHGSVMILGHVENRLAVFCEGPGRRAEGMADQVIEGNWASLTENYLQLGDEEFPVLRVASVLDRMNKRMNKLQELEDSIGESGTFVGDEAAGELDKEMTVPRV